MPDVAFVMAPGAPSADLVAAVRIELARLGMPVSGHATFPEPDPARLYVLVDPAGFVREHGAEALPSDAILRRSLFLSAADPASLPGHRELYARAGRVFEVGADTVAALRRAGVAARLLRPGHHPGWDRFDPVASRPVGVTFAGVPTVEQAQRLERVCEVLGRRGAGVRVLGGRDGAARRAALAESRIALELRRGEDPRLPALGVVEAIHSGAVVVTESAAGLAPLRAGDHFFAAGDDALPWVVDALLRDEARLDRVRRDAFACLRGQMPFAASVAVLRAALLEMLGRSLDSAS